LSAPGPVPFLGPWPPGPDAFGVGACGLAVNLGQVPLSARGPVPFLRPEPRGATFVVGDCTLALNHGQVALSARGPIPFLKPCPRIPLGPGWFQPGPPRPYLPWAKPVTVEPKNRPTVIAPSSIRFITNLLFKPRFLSCSTLAIPPRLVESASSSWGWNAECATFARAKAGSCARLARLRSQNCSQPLLCWIIIVGLLAAVRMGPLWRGQLGPPRRSLSFLADGGRTVLAVKGPLRRAQQRRALDCSGPF